MRRKLSVLYIALIAFMVPLFSAEVVVSPRMQNLSYTMMSEPESLSVQLGLDQQSLILSTDVDTVNGQLVLDRLVAISDPDYILAPGDTISVSYLERTGATPVNMNITIPYGGTISIGSIATIETNGKTFQSVRAEIESALTQYNRYANPIVSIQGLGLFRVRIDGEVTSSRNIRVNGNSFLSDILYYGTQSASSRKVSITSDDGTVREYDPYLGMRKGDKANNPRLRPGDTITLYKRDRAVTISGAINDSGTYQLLEGENLNALINDYALGFDPYASNSIQIQRSQDNGYYEIFSVDRNSDVELKDGDIIYVEPVTDTQGSVSIEGALRSSSGSNNMIQGDRSETYYYRFVEGETVYDMLQAISSNFIASSDLKGAYLIRNGETIMLDFNEILYNGAPSGEMKLRSSDRFVIPFNQMIVSVVGGVENPGVYGYVQGRDAEYYINLAGGYSSDSKGDKGVTIEHKKSGMRFGFNDPLVPETVINVERDNLSQQLASTVTVVSLVASIIGIISSVVIISANVASWPN